MFSTQPPATVAENSDREGARMAGKDGFGNGHILPERRSTLLALGIPLTLVGIPMLILPGPGLLVTGVGVVCLGKAALAGKSGK